MAYRFLISAAAAACFSAAVKANQAIGFQARTLHAVCLAGRGSHGVNGLVAHDLHSQRRGAWLALIVDGGSDGDAVVLPNPLIYTA